MPWGAAAYTFGEKLFCTEYYHLSQTLSHSEQSQKVKHCPSQALSLISRAMPYTEYYPNSNTFLHWILSQLKHCPTLDTILSYNEQCPTLSNVIVKQMSYNEHHTCQAMSNIEYCGLHSSNTVIIIKHYSTIRTLIPQTLS